MKKVRKARTPSGIKQFAQKDFQKKRKSKRKPFSITNGKGKRSGCWERVWVNKRAQNGVSETGKDADKNEHF